MPPPGKSDGVPKTGNSQLLRQCDGILFRGPHGVGIGAVATVGRYGPAQPQPLGVGFASRIQVKAWMVGEDLQARPNDEHHEQQIEEMLPAQPPREPRLDGLDVLGGCARVAGDELVKPPVAGHLPDDGDRQHQTRDPQRDQPQTAEPAPADADRRQLRTGLRDSAGPVVDDDRTVAVALVVIRLQRLPQWIGLPRLHVAPFSPCGHARPAGLDRGRNVPRSQAAPIRSES